MPNTSMPPEPSTQSRDNPPTDGQEWKWCTKGKHWVVASSENFAVHSGARDGFMAWCRVCVKKHRASPKYVKRQRRYMKARKNTVKVKAREAVNQAIKEGKLVRPMVCSMCSQTSKYPLEAHHWSYKLDQWFNVVWVCRERCHGKLDTGRRQYEKFLKWMRKRNPTVVLSDWQKAWALRVFSSTPYNVSPPTELAQTVVRKFMEEFVND